MMVIMVDGMLCHSWGEGYEAIAGLKIDRTLTPSVVHYTFPTSQGGGIRRAGLNLDRFGVGFDRGIAAAIIPPIAYASYPFHSIHQVHTWMGWLRDEIVGINRSNTRARQSLMSPIQSIQVSVDLESIKAGKDGEGE